VATGSGVSTYSVATPAVVRVSRWGTEMRRRCASHIASPMTKSCQRKTTRPSTRTRSRSVANTPSTSASAMPVHAVAGSTPGRRQNARPAGGGDRERGDGEHAHLQRQRPVGAVQRGDARVPRLHEQQVPDEVAQTRTPPVAVAGGDQGGKVGQHDGDEVGRDQPGHAVPPPAPRASLGQGDAEEEAGDDHEDVGAGLDRPDERRGREEGQHPGHRVGRVLDDDAEDGHDAHDVPAQRARGRRRGRSHRPAQYVRCLRPR